jgi:hypothetical protein
MGSYCEGGNSDHVLCPPRYYESRLGSFECQDCPAGFFCSGGTQIPEICVDGYCPKLSAAPTLCPDGTYANETTTQLTSSEDCHVCPNRHFCKDGFIGGVQGTAIGDNAALCDAGYFCDYGAQAKQDGDKICPVGHYCTQGTELPTRCEKGLYNAKVGQTSVKSCVPCQPGYYCIENDGVMRICPKGHFCGESNLAPVPCFEGTYNPEKGAFTSKQCLDCPKGYFCNAKGIADYLDWECPTGHYCPENKTTDIDNYKCPAGTYRNDTGATNKTHACWGCPEGYFCNEGTTYPEPCDAGYYCPVNSTRQYACAPGTYCSQLDKEEHECP